MEQLEGRHFITIVYVIDILHTLMTWKNIKALITVVSMRSIRGNVTEEREAKIMGGKEKRKLRD